MGNNQAITTYSSSVPVDSRYNTGRQYFPYLHSPISVGSWERLLSGRVMKSRYLNSNHIFCGRMENNPPATQLEFPCPQCRQKIFDGGLSKKVVCKCGKTILRKDNEEIM